ncbi:hypothetical protein ACWOAH_08035 [Vagococcus vulneris]|nr:hypothetical protein [Vagococcus vulneris]
MTVIELTNISKSFNGQKKVLNDISLYVNPKGFFRASWSFRLW